MLVLTLWNADKKNIQWIHLQRTFVSNLLFLCSFLALNAQIRVAERPMTKQGLTGMRTAAGRGETHSSF